MNALYIMRIKYNLISSDFLFGKIPSLYSEASGDVSNVLTKYAVTCVIIHSEHTSASAGTAGNVNISGYHNPLC